MPYFSSRPLRTASGCTLVSGIGIPVGTALLTLASTPASARSALALVLFAFTFSGSFASTAGAVSTMGCPPSVVLVSFGAPSFEFCFKLCNSCSSCAVGTCCSWVTCGFPIWLPALPCFSIATSYFAFAFFALG